jgi:hypothetical protein
MATNAKKKNYSGRRTDTFYALIVQLPGYDSKYKELIKEGVINDFLTERHGQNHGRELRLTLLSDGEFRELLFDLNQRVYNGKTKMILHQEAIRKRKVNQILTALSRIGVNVKNGDFSQVNEHIKKLPISKGRIIPQFRFDELDRLLGAVRAYCDNIKKRQIREQILAPKN